MSRALYRTPSSCLNEPVVLLVHHDEPELAHRREERAPGADGDVYLARMQPRPHRVALARREPGVEHRHVVAEARAEARDELRRERDLGDEDDDADVRFARRGDRAQVTSVLPSRSRREGGTSSARDSRKRAGDRIDGRGLRVGEPGGASRGTGSAKNGSAGRSFSSIATSPELVRAS